MVENQSLLSMERVAAWLGRSSMSMYGETVAVTVTHRLPAIRRRGRPRDRSRTTLILAHRCRAAFPNET